MVGGKETLSPIQTNITLSTQDVVTFLGGIGQTAGAWNLHGVIIQDTTLVVRAVDPAVLYYEQLLGDTPTNLPVANDLALHRAAQDVLKCVRTALIAGGKSDQYTIGKLSVTKPQLLTLIKDELRDLAAREAELYAAYIEAGATGEQADLAITNPVEDPDDSSRSLVTEDAPPPYGAFGV